MKGLIKVKAAFCVSKVRLFVFIWACLALFFSSDKYNKDRFKVMATYLQHCNITLSLASYTGSALKRELNFCNDYISLLHFWLPLFITL